MKKIILSILTLSAVFAVVSCKNAKEENFFSRTDQQLYIGDSIAIANTQYGKVRGYIMRDTYTFLGIPYGASTAGENRFMPAKPPQPWDGVKDAVFYGACAPQSVMKYPNNIATFLDCWNYYDMSEDCLNLNVWTPGLDNARRPVIVWLHGGGFSSGNSIEHHEYHGENFSRYTNVVFVSPNHRLNSIGFTDFSGVDPKFKDSGNVGILDLVEALKWVHNNIANFGGDPDNVTIIGQSGGGAKVCNLVAMPETEGLIHKAVALSGNATQAINKEAARGLGLAILEEAGLKPEEMNKLQEMPFEEYMALASRVQRAYAVNHPGLGRFGFGPIADGDHIPVGDFFQSEHCSNVPMLICSTTAEWPSARDDAKKHASSKDEVIQMIAQRVGDEKAAPLYEAFAKVFPDKLPIEINDLVASSRRGVLNTANLKVKQNAPVYVAWFDWQPPILDGRLHAFHTMDIAFWFMNTDLQVSHTGGGQYPRNLSKKMAKALYNFMATGNPNGKTGLPNWPEYTTEEGATMILADKSYVLNAPDKEAVEIMNR
jgi:para-nitrobenzyl esterase